MTTQTQRLRLPPSPPAIGEDEAETPGAEELKQRLVGQAGEAGELVDDKPANPKLLKDWTFPFRYEDGNGRVYEGKFRNRVLTTKQRMLAGALTADLVMGRSVQSLPGATRQLAIAIGWMTFSLIERPDWAKDLAEIEDELVIMSLFEEVWDHQCCFLGRPNDAES